MSDKKSVLFVCLGNICRSPIAEAVFISIVTKENLTEKYRIDSCAVKILHKKCVHKKRSELKFSFCCCCRLVHGMLENRQIQGLLKQ